MQSGIKIAQHILVYTPNTTFYQNLFINFRNEIYFRKVSIEEAKLKIFVFFILESKGRISLIYGKIEGYKV